MSACLLWLGLSALWQAANTQAAFTIDQVTLTVLPGNNVASGTNLSLRCEAKVSHSLPQPLTYSFSFLQDDQVMYSKNTSVSVVERSLSPARVFNSGRYQCTVRIYDKIKPSTSQTLRVTGLQVPTLKVKSDIISEGEDISATCSAPEETGGLNFYFYEDNQEVKRVSSKSNSVTTTLTMQKLIDVYLHCVYIYLMHPDAGFSNKSNTVKVIVQDLDAIRPKISIFPNTNVVEGDRVLITCQVRDSSDLELFLTKGNTLLNQSKSTFTYSLTVRAEDSGDYVCKAEKGSVQKKTVYELNVSELFSKPILRMNPDQVFEGERFTLSCRSDVRSPEKIKKEDIKYTLLKEGRHIFSGADYFVTASLATNGKYSCVAVAKGVNKTSQQLHLKAKVPVSGPVIRVVDMVIVGRPFKVSCESENGTLPIIYTLLKARMSMAEKRVDEAADKALFSIDSISSPEEIYSFTCQAQNQGPSISRTSQPLTAEVIVPVSKPVLEPQDITVTEGSDLTLTCRVQKGTYPIIFTWYHNRLPLPSQKVRSLEGQYIIKTIERDQRGDYYCEASNYNTEIKRSYPARIGVSLAVWKKALIGVFCILLLVAIVIVLTVFLKKMPNPRRKKQENELSVKPSRPKSGDPMRVSLTLDIEDNTILNGTPCVMGRNVWSENVSGSDSDDHTDVDYELVHPQEVDPSKEVLLKKSTEPEDSGQNTEVQMSTPGVSEQAEGAALEYAQLNNSEQEPA
ncbi:platelet endothelial cell adhesion molecule isoform X5 [Pimephales promelas]|uniref:platelet endothelial cell adhesion molecule isoform X5 n=1 Tax=Pimephales promelas TaxID=90988 RepID=UPI001955BEFF|nr:platelet endothelial cell adhesion molecule isoform X5 [Pimephales promelas]